jgi:hypothetical protein
MMEFIGGVKELMDGKVGTGMFGGVALFAMYKK